MAKKRMKKSANRGATHRTLYYGCYAGQDTHIDIAAGLSMLNQRAYEQGRNYVAKVTLWPSVHEDDSPLKTPEGAMYELACNVSALPNTWQVHQAWQLGKDAYERTRKEEVEAGIRTAKYEDFCVGWSENHLSEATDVGGVANGFWGRGRVPLAYLPSTIGANAQEINGGLLPANTDLVFSKVKANAGTLIRGFSWFGNTGTNYNLMNELDKARSVVRVKQDPVSGSGGVPYGETVTDLNIDTVTQMEADGDAAPYRVSGHELALSSHMLYSIPQKGFTRLSSGFMDVPCGLLRIKMEELAFGTAPQEGVTPSAFEDEDPVPYLQFIVQIDVREGSYKGVHATPMGV